MKIKEVEKSSWTTTKGNRMFAELCRFNEVA